MKTTKNTEYRRIPGLLRIWEFQFVMEAGHEYRIEESGTTDDGCELFAVFVRKIIEPS